MILIAEDDPILPKVLRAQRQEPGFRDVLCHGAEDLCCRGARCLVYWLGADRSADNRINMGMGYYD